MERVHNWVCLGLWGAVLLTVLFHLGIDNYVVDHAHSERLAVPIFIMRVAQSLAGLEILYVLAGVTKGSLLPTLLQFLGRIVVALFYFRPHVPALLSILVLLPWAIADLVRYAFYLRRGKIITFLRYNLFIVLYPIGILG
jgi:hypothetical protein